MEGWPEWAERLTAWGTGFPATPPPAPHLLGSFPSRAPHPSTPAALCAGCVQAYTCHFSSGIQSPHCPPLSPEATEFQRGEAGCHRSLSEPGTGPGLGPDFKPGAGPEVGGGAGEAARCFRLLEVRQEHEAWGAGVVFFSLVKEARGICVQIAGEGPCPSE